jgi:hypothetical protein
MMTLDQAIESAKIFSGGSQVLSQDQYAMLTGQLREEEQYSFAMALVDLNIGPRTGRTALQLKVAEFLSTADAQGLEAAVYDKSVEDRLVLAAMHRDAQWLQKLKDKFKQWWEKGPEDEFEEEFGEPFPFPDTQEPGLEDAYDMEPVETIGPGDEIDPLSDDTLEDEGYVAPDPEGPPDFEDKDDLGSTEDLVKYLRMVSPLQEEESQGLYIPEGAEPQPRTLPEYKDVYTPKPEQVDEDEGERGGMPPMVPLDSSNLEAVGYDPDGGLLYIIFKQKRHWPRTLYRYDNVSPSEYSGLLSPPGGSSGKYFNEHIKNTKPYTGPLDPSDYGV